MITPLPAATTSVKVYLIAPGTGAVRPGTIGCADTVVPVGRRVPATRAPLTAALGELLAIKNQASVELGLYNALARSDLAIDRVGITGGTAEIRLVGQVRLAGECDNPRVKAQLEATARQFPTVKDVAITLDGVPLDRALSLR
jgi:hypothetical protein